MHFILVNGSIAKFETLRADYQKLKQVDLSKDPSIIGLPTRLGGTNVTVRNKQISLLEKLKVILQANFIKEEEIETPEQFLSNLTASRVYIAACLYVKEQIGPNWDSKLCELIDSKLGLTKTNYLDENDKEVCFQAANRVLNSSHNMLEEANAELIKAKRKPITESEWKEFTNYLSSKASEQKTENPYTNYPVTSLTKPLCGTVLGYTGATVGFLGGDVVTNSIGGMAARYKVTAVVGGILLLGPVGPAGVALFAPVIAGKLVNTFCKISMAHILGVAMSYVGQGIGMGVGLPLDLAYKLVWKTCSVIGNHYSKENQPIELNGIRIEDGVLVFGGIPVELTAEDDLPKGQDHLVEFDTAGEVFVNGVRVEASETELKMPANIIEELKKVLQMQAKPQLSKEPRVEELPTETFAM